jgi:O-antigen/teichoic acid export membrane protein
VTTTTEPVESPGLASRLRRVRDSRLFRQNLILAIGGLLAGIGGFVYHAVAGRVLGPQGYGEVASLVAIYTMGTTFNLILILVLARYASHLRASGQLGGLRSIMSRTSLLIAAPTLLLVLVTTGLSPLVAAFEHLRSPIPVIWLALALGCCWYMAIPRGVLQGSQRFTGLSVNLSMEIVFRTATLGLMLWAGFDTSGSMVAILAGAAFAYLLGTWSLRDVFAIEPVRMRMRAMVGFAVTASAGTLGILLLYNVDVVLAAHFLQKHDAGIYGGLNKIGTILYFGTLSVSQVLFPRVVEAVASRRHPSLLLLMSAGLIGGLGLCAILVFALVPQLVVGVLFGPQFKDAQAYILAVAFVGLGLSLSNLLVQFFMAVHDRVFIPILAAGCLLQALLITLFHAGIGQVISDVLIAIWLLLAGLTIRCLLLLPRLRPEMVAEEAPPTTGDWDAGPARAVSGSPN